MKNPFVKILLMSSIPLFFIISVFLIGFIINLVCGVTDSGLKGVTYMLAALFMFFVSLFAFFGWEKHGYDATLWLQERQEEKKKLKAKEADNPEIKTAEGNWYDF